MPKEGYTTITVRADVKNRLEEMRKRLGFSSVSDFLVHLMTVYEQFISKHSELKEK